MAARVDWQARRAELVALMRTTQTYAQIGARFGASERAVAQACHRMGLRRPREVRVRQNRRTANKKWRDPAYRQKVAEAVKAAPGLARGRLSVVLRWCPPAYAEEYWRLVHGTGLRAAEAKAMVLAQIATDERRARLAVLEAERRARDDAAAAARAARRAGGFEALLARVAAGEVEVIEVAPMWRTATVLPGGGSSLAGI